MNMCRNITRNRGKGADHCIGHRITLRIHPCIILHCDCAVSIEMCNHGVDLAHDMLLHCQRIWISALLVQFIERQLPYRQGADVMLGGAQGAEHTVPVACSIVAQNNCGLQPAVVNSSCANLHAACQTCPNLALFGYMP
jgi:hypothetical protein